MEDYKLIPLNNGRFTKVSPEDYEWLSQFKWYEHQGYVKRGNYQKGVGKKPQIQMHREILNPPEHLEVDHINRDGLDNRRSNLRTATRMQNTHNTGPRKRGNSKYKGVCYLAKGNHQKRWRVQFNHGGKRLYSDCFATELEAAQAYNKAAKKFLGEGSYAFLNDVPEGDVDINKPQLRATNKTGYRGVCQDGKGFVASIRVRSIRKHIGTFKTPLEAALAYDEKARELLGDKVKLNFP